ncbi:MAG: Oligopeptide-binding protein AppA [Firmicutes bacterium]|nr:Oligopeptide-binding protein AppA [Bacillota bacterium]
MLRKAMVCFVAITMISTIFLGLPATQASSPIRITINGIPLTSDAAPVIQNGRTLVPMRAIFEALGAQVHWDDATHTIRAYRREDAIVLQLGSRTAWVNGPSRQLDVAPIAIGGRTMVPLRFAAEALGAQVAWVDATRTVTVKHTPYTPKPIGGTITFGALSEPIILNPILSIDTASADIHGWISFGLVRAGADLLPRNSIADRWVWDQASLTWTFWLRPNVRWSDGRPLTARDVKFTIDTILHPDYDGPRRINVAHVAEVATDGDHIVRFRLRQVDAPFLSNLWLGILPHHVLGNVPVREHRAHTFSRQPIGAGPYLLERIVPGQFAVLQRNPNFWMAPRPYIERIVFRRYADMNVMQAAFEAGDIDWMTIVPDAVDRVRREMADRTDFREIPAHGYDFMALNHEHSILHDRRVRHALKFALDRPAIVRSVLNGLGTVVHAHQLPTSWASGATGLNTYEFNPSRARQLLDEAGWRVPVGARDGIRRRDGLSTGDPLRLNIMWNTGHVIRQDIAAIAVRQWREIGVDATDTPIEWAVLLGRFERSEFDVIIIGRVPGLDPDPFRFFHSSQAIRGADRRIIGVNYQQFRNTEVDRLLEAGRLTVDVAERRAIYQRIDQILNHELPYIWLFQRVTVRGVWRHVRGIVEVPIAGGPIGIGPVLGEARYIVGAGR